MSRAPQLRSGRVLRFRPASLGTLMGSVAEELRDSKDMEWSTCRRGPLSIDFAAYPEDAQNAVQRKGMALLGQWEPHLHVLRTAGWSHYDW